MTDRLEFFIIFYPLMLFSLSLHEAAHAWVANKFGDPTARLLGRITLNPFPHIDFIGTFVLPVVAIFMNFPLFGWGKPVPVDPRNLKRPREDHLWIALAGPVSNTLLALVIAGIAHGIVGLDNRGVFQGLTRDSFGATALGYLVAACHLGVMLNIALAVFNLLPIFPLDGGGIIRGLLPAKWVDSYDRFAQYGMWIILILLVTGALHVIAVPIQYLTRILLPAGL
ncbi:MAG: site-2 protease family protein [Deltaproteobacteria bacterium CG11_big_fil_rev_8_21_14_0_20_47_16]|nr:MAG: site-2 protease family protein [Deltaproteobacteria bacterium CG11_big_fil_rev_8_21_14_0_20_47_16]